MYQKEVLIICPFSHPNIGGVESHLSKLIKAAVKDKHQVTLITYQPLTTPVKAPPIEVGEGFQILRTNWFGNGWFNKLENYFPLSFLYLFPGLFLKSLKYYLKNHSKVKCIHAHGFAAAAIAVILKKIFPVKIIINTHAVYNFPDRKLLSFLIKPILQNFDFILAVSEVSAKELVALGLDPSKVSVYPNWIDTSEFSPVSSKIFASQYSFNLLFVGRLIDKKGIHLFLNAASKFPKIAFHIIGSGPLQDTVIKHTQKYPNIIFHGSINTANQSEKQQLIAAYSQADYFVSPYLYDEGFSTTLIESLSCGTPLIVTNRGSPPTFLTEQVATFLSSQPTTKELSKIIKKFHAQGNKTKQQSEICRQYAVKHFGPSNARIITQHYII